MTLNNRFFLIFIFIFLIFNTGCSFTQIVDHKHEQLLNPLKQPINAHVGIKTIQIIEHEYNDKGKWQEGLTDILRKEGIFKTITGSVTNKDWVDILIQGKVKGEFRYSGIKNFLTWWPGALILAHSWRGNRYEYNAKADIDLINAQTGSILSTYHIESSHELVHRSGNPIGPPLAAITMIPGIIKGSISASPRTKYRQQLYDIVYSNLWKKIAFSIAKDQEKIDAEGFSSTQLRNNKPNEKKLDIYVSILEFDNLSTEKNHEQLKFFIPNLMTSYLSKANNIQLVERMGLKKLLLESQRKQQGIIDKNNAIKMGKISGASHIITGSYQVNNDEITISSKMYATETGQILRAEHITGNVNEVNRLIQNLVINLSGSNSYALSEEEKQQISSQGRDMMKKIEAISKGELSIYKGDFDSARKFYKEALANDPDNETIKSILKDIDISLKAIAIVDFKNNNGKQAYDVFSRSIPENLTSLIVKRTGLPFTERLGLKSALKEMQLPLQGLIDPETAPKLGKIIGASQLISGSFDIKNDQMTIHARLIDTETGKNIFAHSETGDINSVHKIETTIVNKIITSLANVIVTNNPIAINNDSTTVADKINKALQEGRKEASFSLEESIVSFEFAKANLTAKSFITLQDIAKVLNKHPEYRVYILGHTDNIGTNENNKKLSERRATSVLNKFAEYGVTVNRLNALGEGEDDPIATNETDKGRSKNRRVGLLFKIMSEEKQDINYSILKSAIPPVE